MSRKKAADRLIYLPLGGAGEIGMNANLWLRPTGPRETDRCRSWDHIP